MEDFFGPSMEDFSALGFDPFQADSQEPTVDQRGCKRPPLTEAQRKAKNERDRGRRLEHRVEFERLQKVEFQFKQIEPRFTELQTQVVMLMDEKQSLELERSLLNKRIEELENALLERAAPDQKYRTRKKSLLLQPMTLIGGEINQMIWNTTAVRPRPHLPVQMPDLSLSAAVQTQVLAAMPAEESVIDKEPVTNEFTMRSPFLFVASKTKEVSCIRLRGKCSAGSEGGLLQYTFEWIPHQTNQESWENLGWSPIDVGFTQNLAPTHSTRPRINSQHNPAIKFLLWNSVGALNANRQRVAMELINRLQPAVLVLTETRLSRARADEIRDRFRFDAHRVTPNLGYVGGMWLLWRSGVVEVDVLSFTEQEIHALIREPPANQIPYPWEFFRGVNFDPVEEVAGFAQF